MSGTAIGSRWHLAIGECLPSLRFALPRARRRDRRSRCYRWRLDVGAVEFGKIEWRLVADGDDAGFVVIIRTGATAALHFQREWVRPPVARGGIRGHGLQESDRAKHVCD